MQISTPDGMARPLDFGRGFRRTDTPRDGRFPMTPESVAIVPVRALIARAKAELTVSSLIVAGAIVVAFLLSTQLLAQPFVWENFPLDLIGAAWARLFRNRLIVTVCIALGVIAVRAISLRSQVVRAVVLGLAIAAGAIVGEMLLLSLDYENGIGGLAAFLPRVVRWIVIGIVVVVASLLFERAARERTAARDATLQAARLERQAVESRLSLLRAQIEPHFLFNTLATIRQLHRSEPQNGALMLSNFIEYLKAAIPKARASVTCLRDELDLVRAYLGLIEVRMSGRLTSSVVGDSRLDGHPFPPLSLATLVENAIKHGIVPSDHGGHVSVTVRVHDGYLEASVLDDGVGLSSMPGGSGIGLANTRARLVSLHGPTASLSLMHHQPHGVRATIRIPHEAEATR